MKKLLALVAFSSATVIGASTSANALQAGGQSVTRVVCDGQACGGDGPSPFFYRVKPNGNEITSFEVGIEDGDLNHYGNFIKPNDWSVSIQEISRAHDELSTVHGTVTGSSGTCPFVLRFSGPMKTQTSSNME